MVEYSGYTAKNGTDQIDAEKFSELGGNYGANDHSISIWADQVISVKVDHQNFLS